MRPWECVWISVHAHCRHLEAYWISRMDSPSFFMHFAAFSSRKMSDIATLNIDTKIFFQYDLFIPTVDVTGLKSTIQNPWPIVSQMISLTPNTSHSATPQTQRQKRVGGRLWNSQINRFFITTLIHEAFLIISVLFFCPFFFKPNYQRPMWMEIILEGGVPRCFDSSLCILSISSSAGGIDFPDRWCQS